jgi:hypothetical protein
MSFSDELWNGLGDAVSDIRQKLVEEPMWGRSLGENGQLDWPEPEPEPSFGSSTHIQEMEPDIQPQQDIDLDR